MNSLRPLKHITPAKGWINDPNGFSYFRGKFHIFCQHYPYKTVWGPMHWLHFESEDLLHWKEVGIALKPDQPYDKELGCFSGSAIEKDGKLYVIYTAALDGNQRQCVAISEDGYSFKKYEGNPVIDDRHLPEGYSVSDFRDPKVVEKDGRYYVLCVSRHEDGHSAILLFESQDLLSYRFVGVVKRFYNCTKRGMVECPDIFFEGDRCALIYSLQNPKPEGDKFQNAFPVAYQIGSLDFKTGEFTPLGEEKELDLGFSCYATQTLSHQNKHYIISWESSWGNNYPTAEEGYVGQLSLVKEIHIEGDRLVMNFLSGSGQKKFNVRLEKERASLFINNIGIEFDKKSRKVCVSRRNMDVDIVDDENNPIDERYFYLKDMESIDIEYVYDRSCVELSFQNGDVFFSMLNIKKDIPSDEVIVTDGCIIESCHDEAIK